MEIVILPFEEVNSKQKTFLYLTLFVGFLSLAVRVFLCFLDCGELGVGIRRRVRCVGVKNIILLELLGMAECDRIDFSWIYFIYTLSGASLKLKQPTVAGNRFKSSQDQQTTKGQTFKLVEI